MAMPGRGELPKLQGSKAIEQPYGQALNLHMRKLTILLLFIFPIITAAQGDTSILREAYSNAVNISTSNMPLFNGKQHLGYPSNYFGIPYFKTPDWLPGSVVYSEVLYDDLLLKYDLVSNQLVVKYPNGY